ncbi:MAG: DNA recombination protein RmuC [Bacteroidales bacterium]|jgi:DNA recombination protein RmuC|nr:DNA recombination protein RmuC [Bacteroidales bacterium]
MNIIIIVLLSVLIILLFISLFVTKSKSNQNANNNSEEIKQRLMKFESDLLRLNSDLKDEFQRNRDESQNAFKANRTENQNAFKINREELINSFKESRTEQTASLKSFEEEFSKNVKESRIEQTNSLKSFEDKFSQNVKDFNELQKQKFDDLINKQSDIKKETENKLNEIRTTVENKLTTLQEDNSKKLEEMRKTVDEKLQESVEKRFNESFKLINERLESVHQGLGEMQKLATGVGDLKKVLSNVKSRGTFGEVQLGAILEQVLSPEQYKKNEHPGDDRKVVEYAIKLPGKNIDGEPILLPIDSKFPIEDYERLVDAYDNNIENIDNLRRIFENSVKSCAKDIYDKYIIPPQTTDFAILFVPTEGLYAEILRRPGFFAEIQNKYKVTVVGPTNLVAFLSSLQMGFRTLAIEKRSSEVWEILGAVKTEFGKFGNILDKTQKKLQEAANVINDAGTRSRAIERKLKNVQELSLEQSKNIFGESDIEDNLLEIPDLEDSNK